MKLQAIDSSYFHGKNHFEDDDTQNYLVLQPVLGCFEKIVNIAFSALKSKGLSDESTKPHAASNNSLASTLYLH